MRPERSSAPSVCVTVERLAPIISERYSWEMWNSSLAQDAANPRHEEGLREAMGADRPGRTGRFLDNGLGGNLKRFPSEANRNETFFDTPALSLSCSSRQRFDDGQGAGIPFVDG